MAVTIKKIAELAGVSRGTVDRVIHGRYGVDPAVVARVESIIKQLDYKPNTVARALKKAQKHVKIGIIVPSVKNPYYVDVVNGFRDAEKEYESYGVRVTLNELDQTCSADLLACIEKLIHEGVDGLILAAIDDELIVEKINTISANIPTITYNTDFSDSKRLCFVGQDHVASGSVAGDLMGKSLRNFSKGKVGVLISQLDMLAHTQREKGFRDTLISECPQFEILETIETHELDEISFNEVFKLIERYDDLVGIYVAGGGQGGAGRALKASGKASNIVMICCDHTPDIVELINAGIVDFTIGQEPYLQGYLPVKIMYEFLSMDIKPSNHQIFTRIDICVRENMQYVKGVSPSLNYNY